MIFAKSTSRQIAEAMERDFGPTPTKHWDSAARRHVEHDTTAQETFHVLPGTHVAAGYTQDTAGNIRLTLPPGHTFTPNVQVAAQPARKGDWMQTFTGRQFWPLDPDPAHIAIEDIAHALAMSCRYGGHSLRFYSVAEHSVLMARWLASYPRPWGSTAIPLWALLHDASEAYLADVPRPLKRHLPGYKEAEAKVMAAVCDKFGLPHDMPAEVHEADNRILADEIRQNMVPMDWHAKHDDPLGVHLEFWSPVRAEEEFLRLFEALTAGRMAA